MPDPAPHLSPNFLKSTGLEQMRRVATGLLIGMGVLFLIARSLEHLHWTFGCLRAFSEAAVIGALADWFAVVALFRHPFGLPIPHTAVLPKGQSRVASALADFTVHNFLTEKTLRPYLASAGLPARAAGWLEANAPALAGQLSGMFPSLLASLPAPELRKTIREQIVRQAQSVPLAPLGGHALAAVADGPAAAALQDDALALARRLLNENHDLIREKIHHGLPLRDFPLLDVLKDSLGASFPAAHFFGSIIQKKFEELRERLTGFIADRTIEKLHTSLDEIQADPAHPLRGKFIEQAHRLAESLQSDPGLLKRGEELKNSLLALPSVGDRLDQVWDDLLRQVAEDAAAPGSRLRAEAETILHSQARQLREDPARAAAFNAWATDMLVRVAEAYRGQFGDIIRETVQRWDAEEMSRKIEIEVGRDLQFIRLNGTLVGGTVGLLIHLVSALIWAA